MKIFDLHADIGYDVMKERQKRNHDILKKRHLPNLAAGEIGAVCMASYFEGKETWSDMQAMILALKEELHENSEIQQILTYGDMEKGGLHAILSVEGMCGIQSDTEDCIDWLYEQGVKVASLTWNDENYLATGAKGNPERGLSNEGIKAVKRMEQHHMIIDISHANEKTFWDIMNNCSAMVIATHSNARSLCDHVRNLKDDQLYAIKDRGGIVGVVSAPFFIHSDKDKQDVEHLVDHIVYIKDLIGIDYIALGFDYMNFYEGHDDIHAKGLKDASQSQNIIEELRKRGLSEKEIQCIAYDNALRILNSSLKQQEM